MKQTITIHSFRRAFEDMNRTNFSHEGLGVLFEGLEELERDTGEELELDVIALCCDFEESTFADIASNYCIDVSEDEDIREAVLDFLHENALVIGEVGDHSVIFRQF